MLRPATIVFVLVIVGSLSHTAWAGRTVVRLSGAELPNRYSISSNHIFSNSDTLLVNERVLIRGQDYSYEPRQGYFDLSSVQASADDTVTIIYHAAPRWLQRTFGRELDPASPAAGRTSGLEPETGTEVRQSRRASKLELSGAKSFRFSARSAGNSNFGQSLDLSLSGELADGVTISGSVSDRGVDPAYGTANSRLNELDKVHLRVQSQRFQAELGDIEFGGFGPGAREKAISGATFALEFPNWHAGAVAARPRGVFESVQFSGRDAFQGPYQVSRDSRAEPIVPGSETVWLDGRRLERGANKDYIMDYPTGRITFNVNQPIDARSRIEIDFEPLVTEFKAEMFGGATGGVTDDSTFFFSADVLMEGDDQDAPLVGELSDQERLLLEAAGDSTVVRSGVVVDTTGAYELVVDSLPDSVYAFVGDGNGDFAITFSFVGRGQGAYRFLGSGNYQFVGDGNGDYLPVVIVTAPSRTTQYSSVAGVRSDVLGEYVINLRASRFDQNLLSPLDDSNNDGLYYDLRGIKRFGNATKGLTLSAHRRMREATYRARERINRADFQRAFLLPEGFAPGVDELLHEAEATVQPGAGIVVTGSYGDLRYDNQFDARAGEVDVDVRPTERLELGGGFRSVSTDFASSPLDGDGQVTRIRGHSRYDIAERLRVRGAYEYDRRENAYFADQRGTRYDAWEFGAETDHESVSFKRHLEDSLIGQWSEVLQRSRLAVSSQRRLGYLDYDATLTYQWLSLPTSEQESFLSRLRFGYNNPRSRLYVSSSYAISEEQRNARGITYLEVDPGEGNYSLEDGEFVPDPDGNFIKVEELLSNQARVRRGQKSFQLNKDWRTVLVRFTSNIEEELLEGGERSALWALPFVSDEDQPYLFYSRRYDGDVRLFPTAGFYAVNIEVSHDVEKRDIADDTRRRRDVEAAITLKQKTGNFFLEQKGELFDSDRDDYFAASGVVDGYRLSAGVRRTVSGTEISGGVGFRRAESEIGEVSRQYALLAGTRLTVFSRGELRFNLEGYRQEFENLTGTPSFPLVNNRFGEYGALWSLSLNYGVRSGTRINASLTGRHADNRAARITARGEVVTSF